MPIKILDVKKGSWLVQVQLGGVRRTARGSKGGLEAARKRELELEAELQEQVERKQAAKRFGLKDPAAETDADSPIMSWLGFDEFFEEKYLPWARAELGPATLRARESTHAHLLRFFGKTPIGDINEEMIDGFKNQRMTEGVIFPSAKPEMNRKPRPLSKAGLCEQVKVLRAVLRWAERRRFIERAPLIDMPKDKRREPGAAQPVRYFLPEERVRFLRWCGKRETLKDLFKFGLATGMRPAEIFHIRCRSIDLARGVITCEEQLCPRCPDGRWLPKVGAWRQIEIPADLKPILRRLLKSKKPEDLLFPSTHGAPFSRLEGSGGSFTKVLRRSGLARDGLSMYSLRHTFAAVLVSSGVPLEKIAKLLGHTDVRSTQIYAHLMPSALTGATQTIKLPCDEWSPEVIEGGGQPSARGARPSLHVITDEAHPA